MQIRNYYYKLKRYLRYRKFKSCNLPYPFFDNKRDTFEMVSYYKNNKSFNVNESIVEAIGDISNHGLIYHYQKSDCNKKDNHIKSNEYISHCHNFDELVKILYDYPESFNIPKKFLHEYSKQELDYLKDAQNYLKLIGLKDKKISKKQEDLYVKMDKLYDKRPLKIFDKIHLKYLEYLDKRLWKKLQNEEFKRYNNDLDLIYSNYRRIYCKNKELANAYINGTKNYRIYRKNKYDRKFIGEKYFIIDDDYKYLGVVEVIKEKIIKLKDLKEDMVLYRLVGFNTYKEYIDNMIKEFKEDAKYYNETFDLNSDIIFVTYKVIEKF